VTGMGTLGRTLVAVTGLWLLAAPARSAEADALAISANIRARHMPFGTILDPFLTSPTTNDIMGYTRCGDSALWTGAYLAAEAFRHKVTQSPDALDNVKAAMAGLKGLVDVTGDNRLARCMVLTSSPYAAGIAGEESRNTIHPGPTWIWVDNTSRDEVVGAFFGMGVAFDLVDDPVVKAAIGDVATRLIGFVSHHQWSPNDDGNNTFVFRPEELQMLLQVARHVNPSNNVSGPFFVPPVNAGALFDVGSNSSYFKFNLDYMSFYNLIRLQDNGDNRAAYKIVRDYTASHQNAFFNMVDRALNGPDTARDVETRRMLDQWLVRPRRDFPVDLTNTFRNCSAGESCIVIPVPSRPTTDFIWQRDPFQLKGGGVGFIESPGIDYILPYWMARFYGVIQPTMVQSAAAASANVAPSSIASMFGTNLASVTAQAGSQPLPLTLGGATLAVTASTGMTQNATLIYVSPTQINFVVPDGTAPGAATFQTNNGSTTQTATTTIQPTAPTLFSMNATGSGVAAATAIRTQAGNPGPQSPVPVFQCDNTGCVSVPIDTGVDTPVFVSFYGTGIRNRSALANVTVKINDISVPVQYAGPTPGFTGLDQVNVALTLNLRGSKESYVVLTVDGQVSNAVTINIQ
ncbi:MAG TPA: hypothetical protein VGV35_04605, partial [Bryobacteraceae bacterium]|nr:hypothetical protein [Bryobacteraceae bacterium]